MKEDAFQKNVLVPNLELYERLGYLRFFHVPNGGLRKRVTAALLRAMGAKAGVPDLIILASVNNAPFVGFIEVKRPWKKGDKHQRGRLSKEQKDWRGWLQENWFEWALVESLSEMNNALISWDLIPEKMK